MLITFVGLSGVGKTSLVEALCQNYGYHTPVFTVTRKPREDDLNGKFEYVSVKEYLGLRQSGDFLIDMGDGVAYFGYQKRHIDDRECLIYGSPYHLTQLKDAGSVIVLVEGDTEHGLSLRRGSSEIVRERTLINAFLAERFYNQPEFRQQVDIFFHNDFSCINILAERLHRILVAS